MGIYIRPMRLEHIESIMAIEAVSFGSHHWSNQSFANELSNPVGSYFVAMEKGGGRLLGYSGFWLIGHEPYYDHCRSSGVPPSPHW